MAQTELTAFAPAKINLFLHVLGKRSDGFHELESLVVFADIGDRLDARPKSAWGLDVVGPFAAQLVSLGEEDNLVLKAARLAEAWASSSGKPLGPLHFTLEKNLPLASGIGGGSADAAAALRLCAQAAGLVPDQDLFALSAALGADVPVCLFGKSAWVRGIGEAVEPASVPEGLSLVLANPRVGVSTAEVFARLDARPVAPQDTARPVFTALDELAEFLSSTTNDLEMPAREIAPTIGKVLDELAATRPLLSRMSGSGATCFGLYENKDAAEAAASALGANHPDWWVVCAGVDQGSGHPPA